MNTFFDKAYAWLLLYGPKILIAIVLLFIGFWLIKKFRKLVSKILVNRNIDASLRPFLTGSLAIVLQVLLIFAVMQIVGIQLTIFAALIGALGVAGGLALSGTLQNFTSGIIILILKPFRVGDNIISQSIEGTVTMIRIFYTVVTTFDNRTVIFPNSKLSNEVIINLSREGKRRLDIELKFGFGVPFEKVKPVIESAVKESANFLKEPVARIGVAAIVDDGYKVLINVWSHAHGYQDTKMEFQERLIDALTKSDISFK